MDYEAYERRIRRIARILNFIRKHAVLIVSVLITATVLTTGFFSVRGIILDHASCTEGEYLYGEEIRVEAKALFSKVEYEYAPAGSDDWKEEIPLLPGEYQVRAVATRGINGDSYSNPATFTIQPRTLEVGTEQTQVVYGTMPTLCGKGFLQGDRIETARFEFANLQNPDGVIATPVAESIRILNSDGLDVTAAYRITVWETPVQLLPTSITLEVADAFHYYDETSFSYHEYSWKNGALAEGDRAEVIFAADAALTAPATIPNRVESIRILKGEIDVTQYYTVNREIGTLTVAKRQITVLTSDGEKVYDGTALQVPSADLSAGELAEGHRISVLPGSETAIVNAGSVANRLDLAVVNAEGKDVTDWYVMTPTYGTLTVQKRPVTFVSASASKVYDGQSFASEIFGVMESEEGILPGHRSVYTTKFLPAGQSQETAELPIRAGSYQHLTRLADVIDEQGQSVMGNYISDPASVYGTLCIERKQITLVSLSGSKVYDAKATHGYQALTDGEQPAVGDRLILTFEGIGENAGIYENRFRAEIYCGSDRRTESYDIVPVWGRVTVEKRQVTFTTVNDEVVYDGTPQSAGLRSIVAEAQNDQSGTGLINGHGYTGTFDLRGPDAGMYENNFVVTKITHGTKNLTDNYTVKYGSKGTLTIKRRPVVVDSGSDTKIYDRTPLTCNTATAHSLDALVNGHRIVFTPSASQLLVGETKNSFTVDRIVIMNGDSDVTGNYEVIAGSFGTLSVTKRPITFVSLSLTKVYNARGFEPTETDIMILGELLEGDRPIYDFSYAHSVINVSQSGAFVFDVATIVINDPNYSRYTQYYDMSDYLSYGALTVTPRPLTVVSDYGVKTYDGEKFSVKSASPVAAAVGVEEGLVSGHRLGTLDFAVTSDFGSYGPTVGTYENIFRVLSILDSTGIEVEFGNYRVTEISGTLTIEKRHIFLSSLNETLVYNGAPQAGSLYEEKRTTVATQNLLPGHTPVFYFHETESADVGIYQNHFAILSIAGTYGESVTQNYEFNSHLTFGTLTIKEREIILVSPDARKVYDGRDFSDLQYVIVADDSPYWMVDGDWIEATFVTCGPNAGSYTNRYSNVKIYNKSGEVTSNYRILESRYGRLIIDKRYVVLGSPDAQKPYDGTPLFHDPRTYVDQTSGISNQGLVEGHFAKLAYLPTATITNVGSVVANFNAITIYDQNGNSVIDNYDFNAAEGNRGILTVTKRTLILMTESAQMYYNGTEQWHRAYQIVGGDGVLATDELQVTFLNSVTNVKDGVKPNAVTCVVYVKGSNNRAVDGNGVYYYEIAVPSEGTIEILPRPIIIVSGSASKVYDGSPLSSSEWTVWDVLSETEGILPGQTVVPGSVLVGSSQTKAGSTLNGIGNVQIKNGDENVTGNYAIEKQEGTLEVQKRSLTLLSGSATKKYDGKPLTEKSDPKVSGDGYASTDTPRYHITGIQEGVGKSKNTYTVSIRHPVEGDVTASYDIHYEYGTLEILRGKLFVATDSASKAYDGKTLTESGYSYKGLADGDTIHVTVYGSQTEVGRSPNFFSVTVNGCDASINYELVTAYGTLLVYDPNIPDQDTTVEDPKLPEDDDSYGNSNTGKSDGEMGEVLDPEGDITGEIIGDGNAKPPVGLNEDGKIDGSSDGLDEESQSSAEAFRLYSDVSAPVYMRYMSYGDYDLSSGRWLEGTPYSESKYVNPLYLTACKFKQMNLTEHILKVTLNGSQYLLPYFATDDGGSSMNDVLLEYAEREYVLSFIPDNMTVVDMWHSNREALAAEFDDEVLAAFEAKYYEYVKNTYLNVPDSTKAELAKIASAKGWRYQGGSSWLESEEYIQIVYEIADYIQHVAKYDTDPVTCVTAGCNDPVLCFLQHTGEGVCRHFASAATLLYRTVGIPARYVIGYAANTIAGQTVSISGKTAHAWVEIYLENIGWVPVEVTGGDQGEEPDDPIEPDIPEDPSKPTVTVYPTNTTLPYNGKEQFCSGAKVSGLPSGYKAEVITNLSGMGLTGVGIKEISLQNGSMQIIIRDSKGNDVTDQFNIRSDTGTLEIQPISLTVYPYNATYEYNGKEQFCPNAYIMGLPKGYTARIITNLSGMGRTDVGTSIISFEMGTIQVIIYDENGNNVTQCCQMDCVEATLEITPKTVVVTTASASQAYKGAALSANSWWITQGDVLDGHTLQILETTVLRVPGEAKNEIVKWRVMDESGSEVSPDNYTIVCQAGTLTLY